MIVEYVRHRVADGQSAALIDAHKQAAKYLDQSPQGLSFELSQCVEDKGRYIPRIEWKSIEPHIEGFRKEPGFGEFCRLVKPFTDHIQEMQHYEATSVVKR